MPDKIFSTTISHVLPGKVLLRGYSLEEIISKVSYPAGVYLTLVGRLPTPDEEVVVDAMLNTLLDHGFIASTVIAARYATSGNPQFIPGVAAGLLGAGSNTVDPSHTAELMEQARALMESENLTIPQAAERIVAERVAARQRIPGLGHPTHKAGDFRADVLIGLAEKHGFNGQNLQLLRAIHEAFVRRTGRTNVPINIDGCLAAIGLEMGLSPLQITAIAALSVLPGIMAHVIEEIEHGRALRTLGDDLTEYVGEPERPLPR